MDKTLTKGKPKNATAPTILAAPYYGAVQVGRAGYSEAFVERVRHCEYPQFLWDRLPSRKPMDSILRLDHLQPIGTHRGSLRIGDVRLSDQALEIVDELVTWLLWGGVDEDGLLVMYREQIEATFAN